MSKARKVGRNPDKVAYAVAFWRSLVEGGVPLNRYLPVGLYRKSIMLFMEVGSRASANDYLTLMSDLGLVDRVRGGVILRKPPEEHPVPYYRAPSEKPVQ